MKIKKAKKEKRGTFIPWSVTVLASSLEENVFYFIFSIFFSQWFNTYLEEEEEGINLMKNKRGGITFGMLVTGYIFSGQHGVEESRKSFKKEKKTKEIEKRRLWVRRRRRQENRC